MCTGHPQPQGQDGDKAIAAPAAGVTCQDGPCRSRSCREKQRSTAGGLTRELTAVGSPRASLCPALSPAASPFSAGVAAGASTSRAGFDNTPEEGAKFFSAFSGLALVFAHSNEPFVVGEVFISLLIAAWDWRLPKALSWCLSGVRDAAAGDNF